MDPIEAIELDDVLAARGRIEGLAHRTPLVPVPSGDDAREIRLKLENLQPIGSFKLRGAGNAMRLMNRELLQNGVYTASAGNMAQGVAYIGSQLGVDVTVVVPDHAPQSKLERVEHLGGRIIKIPFDEWWDVLQSHHVDGLDATFIHPVSDPTVIAGNATIGLEILEDWPEVEAIVVPYGGGGLSCGIACAAKAIKPEIKVYAAEVETAAPLRAALNAGRPVPVEYRASFVDGIGGRGVLREMWPLARTMLDGSLVVSLEQVEEAMRQLAMESNLISEGAGAASLAAASAGIAPERRIACVISGGNIDPGVLGPILVGAGPRGQA